MCYHTSHPGEKQIRIKFKSLGVEYSGEPIYHVSGFSRPYLPVTLNTRQDVIESARWKLLPFWVKTEQEAAKYANTLNAEGETIFEKASYKPYISKYRGLLYVDGFYEPHKVAGVKDTENYYLHLPEKEIFTLGIVFAPWKDQVTGEGYNTFSIITSAANPQLEEIHNEKKRMPLVIDPADRESWLNEKDPAGIKQLIRPWDGEFQAHRVARVTAARGEDTNRPDIQQAI